MNPPPLSSRIPSNRTSQEFANPRIPTVAQGAQLSNTISSINRFLPSRSNQHTNLTSPLTFQQPRSRHRTAKSSSRTTTLTQSFRNIPSTAPAPTRAAATLCQRFHADQEEKEKERSSRRQEFLHVYSELNNEHNQWQPSIATSIKQHFPNLASRNVDFIADSTRDLSRAMCQLVDLDKCSSQQEDYAFEKEQTPPCKPPLPIFSIIQSIINNKSLREIIDNPEDIQILIGLIVEFAFKDLAPLEQKLLKTYFDSSRESTELSEEDSCIQSFIAEKLRHLTPKTDTLQFLVRSGAALLKEATSDYTSLTSHIAIRELIERYQLLRNGYLINIPFPNYIFLIVQEAFGTLDSISMANLEERLIGYADQGYLAENLCSINAEEKLGFSDLQASLPLLILLALKKVKAFQDVTSLSDEELSAQLIEINTTEVTNIPAEDAIRLAWKERLHHEQLLRSIIASLKGSNKALLAIRPALSRFSNKHSLIRRQNNDYFEGAAKRLIFVIANYSPENLQNVLSIIPSTILQHMCKVSEDPARYNQEFYLEAQRFKSYAKGETRVLREQCLENEKYARLRAALLFIKAAAEQTMDLRLKQHRKTKGRILAIAQKHSKTFYEMIKDRHYGNSIVYHQANALQNYLSRFCNIIDEMAKDPNWIETLEAIDSCTLEKFYDPTYLTPELREFFSMLSSCIESTIYALWPPDDLYSPNPTHWPASTCDRIDRNTLENLCAFLNYARPSCLDTPLLKMLKEKIQERTNTAVETK